MSQAVRQTRSYLMNLFAKHGFNPRHDLGQNFLIDLNIIELIVSSAELCRNDVVLEIGAGTGGMSTFMATQAAEVISVELDSNMFQLASETTSHFGNITLLHQDALRNKNNIASNILDLLQEKLAVSPSRRLKLVSNLPYNVATPIISNLIGGALPFSRMVVTIQLELGLKMKAKPGDGTYGSLSVFLQSLANVKVLRKLPPSVFWPRPKVNSAVVQLIPNPLKRKQLLSIPFFNDFVRRLFHQRRKFMRSLLVGMYRKDVDKSKIDEVLDLLKIAPDARAEQLRPAQLLAVSNAIYQLIEYGELSVLPEVFDDQTSSEDDDDESMTTDLEDDDIILDHDDQGA